MRWRHKQRSGGFTLVELLIVILILGLLASLVMTSIGRSLQDARRVSTEQAAIETQQAIALYRQYTGSLPDLITSWDPLISRTTAPDGRTVGPFLPHPPRNMFVATNPSSIADGDDPVLYTDAASFLYDYNGGNGTGRFIAALEPAP
jgi:prepilin-type N-terminal cleavage/methylation domain-containing protein